MTSLLLTVTGREPLAYLPNDSFICENCAERFERYDVPSGLSFHEIPCRHEGQNVLHHTPAPGSRPGLW